MLHPRINIATSAINRPKSAVFNCALVFLINGILPAWAGEDLASVQLKPMLAGGSADVIEMDSADTGAVKQESAQPSKAAQPEAPMQTIDSESVNTVEPAPVKVIDQELPAIQPEAANSSTESTKKNIGEKTTQFVEHLPQRLSLFSANVVVATPATLVRRSTQYTGSMTKELIGDHKNPLLLVPATALTLYYSLTAAIVEAPVFGIINSWKHSADGHISKESLGLEESK